MSGGAGGEGGGRVRGREGGSRVRSWGAESTHWQGLLEVLLNP